MGLSLRSFTGYISFVEDPPKPPPPLKVTCPDCGSKDAVIVYVHHTEKGCLCLKCHFSWVNSHNSTDSVS
jgi:hypothetical protein